MIQLAVIVPIHGLQLEQFRRDIVAFDRHVGAKQARRCIAQTEIVIPLSVAVVAGGGQVPDHIGIEKVDGAAVQFGPFAAHMVEVHHAVAAAAGKPGIVHIDAVVQRTIDKPFEAGVAGRRSRPGGGVHFFAENHTNAFLACGEGFDQGRSCFIARLQGIAVVAGKNRIGGVQVLAQPLIVEIPESIGDAGVVIG